jgi:hypothetical protein
MDEAAREVLSRRLSEMKLRQAIREIRSMDRDANMVMWRNSMWNEYHTKFLLPNAELTIILVEKNTVVNSKHEIGGGPEGAKAQDVDYHYVEARVTALERPAHKRGGYGPSALKQATEREDA